MQIAVLPQRLEDAVGVFVHGASTVESARDDFEESVRRWLPGVGTQMLGQMAEVCGLAAAAATTMAGNLFAIGTGIDQATHLYCLADGEPSVGGPP